MTPLQIVHDLRSCQRRMNLLINELLRKNLPTVDVSPPKTHAPVPDAEPPKQRHLEPLGLKYWLDAVPVARTPEESESILEAIQRRQSENWSTKPDWQYGDSL